MEPRHYPVGRARVDAVALLGREAERFERSQSEVLRSINELGATATVPLVSSDIVRSVATENGDIKPGIIYGSILNLRDRGIISLDDVSEEVRLIDLRSDM